MADYTIDEIYDDLIKLVYWLANEKSTDAVLMSRDELVGELSLEMFKVFKHYQDKDLPKKDMLFVIKRSLNNRIGELKFRYHMTHRSAEDYIQSLDADSDDDNDDRDGHNVEMVAMLGVPSPSTLYDSIERVQDTRRSLSPDAMRIFDVIVDGDISLQMQMELVADRAFHVGRGGSITVRAWHLAAALGLSNNAASAAFREIKAIYREVCDG